MLKRLNQVIVLLVIFSSCNFNNKENQIKHEEDTPTEIETTNLITNIKTDKDISKDCIDVIVKHFDAIKDNNIEAYKDTIKPEDGGDLNSEPSRMETFNYYKSTNIYVKSISEYKNNILEVIVWDSINNIDKYFYIVASQDSEGWGINRYINEIYIEQIKKEPAEKQISIKE